MAALPASADFTGPAVTEAGFKTAITGQRDFLSGLLGTDGTIATGQSTLKTLCGAANARSAGTYTILATDRGKVIHVTGSGASAFTVPTTATADFGVGWACAIRNDCSSGDITLTRSSTDTIDGGTSLVIAPGQSTILFVAASGKWVTIGKGSGAATEAAAGIVELATTAEAAAGTSTTHAVTPAGVLEAKKLSNGTATTSTTGAIIMPLSGIPSWARRVTLAWSSLRGTNPTFTLNVQIGDAGGYETSGYRTNIGTDNSGFGIIPATLGGQTDDLYGGTITLVKTTGNVWSANWVSITSSSATAPASGYKELSDVLTQIRVIMDIGTFNLGTLTAYWE